MPLLDEQFEETKETLATRAEYSARAVIALNLQFDNILGTLPPDEGDEKFQYQTLENLAKENEIAGALWRKFYESILFLSLEFDGKI